MDYDFSYVDIAHVHTLRMSGKSMDSDKIHGISIEFVKFFTLSPSNFMTSVHPPPPHFADKLDI